MTPLNKIILTNKSCLSESDLVICDYLQENISSIPTMTLSDLAQNTYSSKSNILRLLKKLSFSGFTDFKYYLLAQGEESKSQPYIDNIHQKFEMIDTESISIKFNEMIKDSKNIYLFSTGQDQQIQAKNLANYLLKVGIIATFVPLNINAELTSNIISSIQPTDLIIIFSNRGNNDTLKTCFNHLNNGDYRMITFTAFKSGWIQDKAELAISLEIQQFQDSTLEYQSGMIHLLLNILCSKL